MLYQIPIIWEGKINRTIFPSQSRPKVHFAGIPS
jgi:hypothetical protein